MLIFSTSATHVVQDLTFYVGHGHTHYMHGKHMAYVLKMSRGHTMPPTFTHANEWFYYAFATSEVKGLFISGRIMFIGLACKS